MNCISLPKLIEQWQADSVIDRTEPGIAITDIPKLHAKYVSQISAHSVALKLKRIEHTRVRKQKVEYYSGRMDAATLKQLGWEPFRFILKQDLPAYLDADEDLIKLQEGMINNEEAINFCTAVVKELNSRTYQIRGFMDWEKFVAGQ